VWRLRSANCYIRVTLLTLLYKVAWAEAYLRAKYRLDPSSRLATLNIGRILGSSAPFLGRERGPHLTQSRLCRGLPPTNWHLDPCSHSAATDMGRKLVGLCPFGSLGGEGGCTPLEEGELGPSLTQCGQGRVLLACQVSS